MNKKIFKLNVLTSMAVLAVSFTLMYAVLFAYFEGQIFNELKSEAKYISYGIANDGVQYLDNFNNKQKRITLINEKGEVIADTVADGRELGNHAERKEVKEAMLTGFGRSARFSDTMTAKTLYYAVRLDDGSILRVSTRQDSIFAMMLTLFPHILFVIITAIIIAIPISVYVSRRIIKPLNDLDLDNPADNEAYNELAPLLSKIAQQKELISAQIREVSEKREEFNLIAENMNEGLLIIDSNAKVLSHNKAAVGILGAPANADGAHGSVYALNRSGEFRSIIESALSGKKEEAAFALNGKSYNISANPVYQENRVIGAVIMLIDVTESLEREKMRREFTSNVSHQLKTPMTSILGFAEIMKSGRNEEESVKEFSGIIYDETKRLVALVGDIIKLAELDEGAPAYHMCDVDLYETAVMTAGRLESAAHSRDVRLAVFGEPCPMRGSPAILEDMIYNLVDNAIKYNKAGGRVEVSVDNADDRRIILTVRDSGIGVPAADKERIFERFYTVDKAASRERGGTGLGLAIVKHGAKFHNAEISLESTLGSGTEVRISFPK